MKIIYIPGFLEGKEQLPVIKFALSKHNVMYFKYDTGLKESVPKLALQLKHFIDKIKLKKNEKLGIIGFSAGGIIADYYLKFIDSSKVSMFISICAPVRGTFLPNVCSKKRKGLQQLKKDSKFLSDLQKKKLQHVKKLSIWCPYDLIVSGKPAKQNENSVKTCYFLHVFAPCWPTIISKIRKLID